MGNFIIEQVKKQVRQILNEAVNIDPDKTFTSDEILKGDSNILDDYSSLIGYMKYKPTSGEIAWSKYIRGKYSIADFFERNLASGGVLTIDFDEMTKALDEDMPGKGKAVNLSDDSALQKIFFLTYRAS